jgi:protocatechuate 3,4-dioxygenase beta subunit
MNRRSILKKSLLGLGAVTTFKATASSLLEACGATPAQTEGPFYPIKDQVDKDWDLTQVIGKTEGALGEIHILKGIVQDGSCKPISNAVVEIWQACETGKYNHPGDPTKAKLDPNFQYWGRVITNAKGEYMFKTIKPGAYNATATWIRPPHIHMKVQLRGFEELTTQIYWEGDQYNRGDRILQNLRSEDRNKIIIKFNEVKDAGKVYYEGHFPITLSNI